MQTLVNKNGIVFQHALYTLIVPKQSNIEFILHDSRQTVGFPLALQIKSNSIQATSALGTLFYLLHKAILSLSWRIPQVVKDSQSPTSIMFVKNIRPFLNDLKNNGYNVDQEINKLEVLASQPVPQEQITGTKKWKKDKLKLVLTIFIIIEVVLGVMIFMRGENLNDSMGEFYGLSFVMAIIFFIVYIILLIVSAIKK